MRRILVTTATVAFLAACAHPPKEVPSTDAAAPIARPAPRPTPSSPVGTVTIPGTIDRAKAQAIGMEYARRHWPELKPSFATAFILRDGSFKVVVAFDKSHAGASVYVRNTDGEVMDASIAGNH